MRCLYPTVILLTAFLFLQAGSGPDADAEYRQHLRAVVSEGNRQYDRGSRPGIMRMADSLAMLLDGRSRAGMLDPSDSLEFTADLKKLLADWHYENSYDVPASADSAEALFKEALHIYDSNGFFSGHLQYAPVIHRELAQLYYKEGDYSSALGHTAAALELYSRAFQNGEFGPSDPEYDTYLDLSAQMAFCRARMGDHTAALALIDTVLGSYPSKGDNYYETLRKKGKILMLSGNPAIRDEAVRCYRDYFLWQKERVSGLLSGMDAEDRELYWMRMRPFMADCYQTEDSDPAFLFDVTLFCKGLLLQLGRLSGSGPAGDSAVSTLRYSWKDIRSRLGKEACAIEFVQYEAAGETRMGALLLRGDGSPRWVGMTAPEEFLASGTGGITNRDRIFSADPRLKNELYGSGEAASMIWNDSLLREIGDCRKIYFAPDGFLHQIAMEYILPEQLQGRSLYRLTSTRRLMEDGTVRTGSALVIGGVLYEGEGDKSGSGTTFENDTAAFRHMRDSYARFTYLPGTRAECDSVMAERHSDADTLLMGNSASEEAFRSLCGKYHLLSLATHGWFRAAEVPQGTDLKPCLSDGSLSQSVLALAGAGRNIRDGSFDISRPDGLLSAQELSQCDMSQVDLAILSACQTGLGYVTADGVYGIQRGLKNAGVGAIMVSLWNVDDRASSRMVAMFHRNLVSGMTPGEAFRSARSELAASAAMSSRVTFNAGRLAGELEPVREDYSEPRFCDAFVLIDVID